MVMIVFSLYVMGNYDIVHKEHHASYFLVFIFVFNYNVTVVTCIIVYAFQLFPDERNILHQIYS